MLTAQTRMIAGFALHFLFPALLLAEQPPSEPAITARDRAHWSFQRPIRARIPNCRSSEWVRTPVDAFILSRLEGAGLKPALPVDRGTLLRRITFDLIGLPPAPKEVEDFLADSSPGAYERVVERLLASPHYGERWAQHWLDVVRFAESNGYEIDAQRTQAWRYRDYVIRSFNEDKPYDRFVTEQLAGDELAGTRDPKQVADLLVATGFNLCGPIHLVSGNTDPEVNRQEVLTEMANGVSAAFLGLTMGCARCHDHKFDPISHADYYRLQSFFAAAQPKDVDIAEPNERAAYNKKLKEIDLRIDPLRQKITQLEAPYRAKLTEAKKARLEPSYRQALATEESKRTVEQRKLAGQASTLIQITWDELLEAFSSADRTRRAAWRAELYDLEALKPAAPDQAWAIRDEQRVPKTYLLARGDPKRKSGEVKPAFPRVLVDPQSVKSLGAGSARLDRIALARWLTSPKHPLTARVMVNRLWQHHFGQGLVTTPNDFGLRGQAPSHPELLDWLACEFIDQGWSLKHLHRLMVLSSTYQQASRVAESNGAVAADPGNRLLGHMNRRRLEGEILRDHLLATAGTLNLEMAGPKVYVPLEPEVYQLIFTEGEPDGLWPVTPDSRQHTRRSIYLFAKRNLRLPLLEAFDRPDSLSSCPVRPVSTFAPQALILMNGPFAQEQSKGFAARLMKECGSDSEKQIDRAYRLAFSRAPRSVELRFAREFLALQKESILRAMGPNAAAGAAPGLTDKLHRAQELALAHFCLAVMNSNEFIYVQ
ncbi:MAG TPA: DUF1553 domain-containing protein [Gemmataceae bacterium]|nr:DUF1553 domain-containing protein [Gemmataceae bacterium]